MSIEEQRARFEAWWISRPHRKQPAKYQNGDYVAPSVHSAWSAWQAALDSVCVTLPPEWPPISEKDEGANEMRSACEDAIHAAGVKTK